MAERVRAADLFLIHDHPPYGSKQLKYKCILDRAQGYY